MRDPVWKRKRRRKKKSKRREEEKEEEKEEVEEKEDWLGGKGEEEGERKRNFRGQPCAVGGLFWFPCEACEPD